MVKLEYVVEEGYHGRIIELRQEVLDFALEMEIVLKQNDAEKGDSFKTCDIEFLHDVMEQRCNRCQRR